MDPNFTFRENVFCLNKFKKIKTIATGYIAVKNGAEIFSIFSTPTTAKNALKTVEIIMITSYEMTPFVLSFSISLKNCPTVVVSPIAVVRHANAIATQINTFPKIPKCW